jgi:N-acetylmuramoyl-L-alanine amidase
MKICITVGHSILKGGNITSASGYVNEYKYNKELGAALKKVLEAEGQVVDLIICPEYQFTTKNEEATYKVPKVNAGGYDLLIELHLNAADGNAQGTEVLYKSNAGKEYATRVVNKLGSVFKNRGPKLREDLYILKVKPVAILIESFFCDSKVDYEKATSLGFDGVAKLIAEGVLNKTITTKKDDITGHWAETTIRNFITKGYVSGYSDGTFKPDNSITRAEFITIINKIFSYTQEADISFTDVKSSDWYYKEVRKAVSKGYVTGYSDNTFKPTNPVTREEAAVIVSRVKGLKANSTSNLSKFKDAQDISSWAKEYVDAVVAAGYITGYEDSTFKPKNNVTRAEAVVILSRAL